MRILITTHAMPSHFSPMQPFASAARAAGHTVACASAPKLAEAVQRTGCEFFAAGTDLDDPAVMALLRKSHSLPREEQARFMFGEVFGGLLSERLAPDLARIFDAFCPDVVISELTEMTGATMAEARGLPACTFVFGRLWRPEHLARTVGEGFAQVRPRFGLDPAQPLASYERSFKLVPASRSYQPHDLVLPSDVCFFRPGPFETTGAETLPEGVLAAKNKPLVYGTLGTVAGFNTRPGALRSVIDAIGACDAHGIVTCGRNQDPASFGPLPPQVRVERFIPQALLMPHCDVVIGHGGYGTTLGALAFGVPLVLTPLGADQPDHAEGCRELGVAEVLMPGEVTSDALAAALRKVLVDPRYAERARAQRDELQALMDVTRAVEVVEAFSRRAGKS